LLLPAAHSMIFAAIKPKPVADSEIALRVYIQYGHAIAYKIPVKFNIV